MRAKKFGLAFSFIAILTLFTQLAALAPPSYAGSPVASGKPNLEVDIDVGSILFRGEMAEFYILVSQAGNRLNAEISANLYYDGALFASVTSLQEHVGTGLFRIPYTIPMDASPGAYTLVVDASYPDTNCNFLGTGLKSFQLSQSLSNWNAWLIEIRNNIATIKTDIGTIKVDIDKINVTLISIEGRIATIQTEIGTIKTSPNGINATLIAIEGKIATIQTTVGNISTDIDSINAKVTSIQGDMATLTTDLGDLKGTILSIKGDTAKIKTNIGEILIVLNSLEDKPTETSLWWVLIAVIAIASASSGIYLYTKRGKKNA